MDRVRGCSEILAVTCVGDIANDVHVSRAPLANRTQRTSQIHAEILERIFDMRRYCLEISPPHQPVDHHFLQLLTQHLFADIADEAPQLAEPARLAAQMKQDEQLLFSANEFKHGFHAATERGLAHPPFSSLIHANSRALEILPRGSLLLRHVTDLECGDSARAQSPRREARRAPVAGPHPARRHSWRAAATVLVTRRINSPRDGFYGGRGIPRLRCK